MINIKQKLKQKKGEDLDHQGPGVVIKARKFAKEAHIGQLDDAGKPFFKHPFQVAEILMCVTNDSNLIAAGYLHDVLEDTNTPLMVLLDTFGQDITNLVIEVTHHGNKKTGYYFPHLKTQRGIMLKFADRLSNLSRMEPWDPKRRDHYLKKSKFWKSKGGDK